jgi:hypothetical protein
MSTNPLKTFKDKDINKIGEAEIKYLSNYKIDKDGFVEFKMLTGIKNTDEKSKDKEPIIYPNISFLTHFWINTENGPIEIGAIDFQRADGSFKYKKMAVDGTLTAGKIRLFGNNIQHQMLLSVLLLSPENEMSPYKDSSIKPMFTLVDAKADAKRKSLAYSDLFKSLKLIEGLSDASLAEFNMAFGGRYGDSTMEMSTRLQEAAVSDAKDFLSKINLPETKLKSTIQISIQKGHIQYDPMQHRYFWVKTQQTIAAFDRIEGADEVDLFIDYLQNAKNGPSILGAIEELNNPTEKSDKKPTENKK